MEYPQVITRFGSAIQGALNARIFTNPVVLRELSKNPSKETYTTLIKEELARFLQPLTDEIQRFTEEVKQLCSFDPFPHFHDFAATVWEGTWPESLDEPLAQNITQDPTQALDKLEQFKNLVVELKSNYETGYVTDCHYSTVEELWTLHEIIEQSTQPITHFRSLKLAITYAYNTHSDHSMA
ncbi:hypothetical protein P4N68_00500 [Corynebacterium felinum]|uniref:Uncharacterized protein n=1 Tax=Corynebacterium felinum TaxID=131318 RepID=A0ABU2B6R7_9CORY|nr:hypothetical protein [Corynebacterium felinum]MDF5819563.1 hypothetical protein [Corynebacterium felinum]MDR7354309.1 hypothetical protein [Corynebacterium felinum]WJY93686.1 hypothetical protein CFELI_00130 [Corynebacterium felinum]